MFIKRLLAVLSLVIVAEANLAPCQAGLSEIARPDPHITLVGTGLNAPGYALASGLPPAQTLAMTNNAGPFSAKVV